MLNVLAKSAVGNPFATVLDCVLSAVKHDETGLLQVNRQSDL
jgi:hypothetical protein